MLKRISIPHLWFRWQLAPSAVSGASIAAIALALYLPYAAFANNPNLALPLGHTLSPIPGVACGVVLVAIAIGLLNKQSWSRVIHLLQPIWLEIVIFVDQGGIPKPSILNFDLAAGVLWISVYWWFMFKHESAKDWFEESPSGDDPKVLDHDASTRSTDE